MKDADVKLMLDFKKGDTSAFEKIVIKYYPELLNLAYKFLGNRVEAEDACQEIFVKIFKTRKRYKPQATLRTFLYRITYNHCVNISRQYKRKKTYNISTLLDDNSEHIVFEDTSAVKPAQILENEESKEKVLLALQEIPENQRIALILNVYDNLPYDEIAATLDLTLSATKSLIYRAKQNVKNKLSKYFQD